MRFDMARDKKTNSEYIIDTLLSGQPQRSPDITRMVSEASGKEIKIQDVASIIAKLSNGEKCDLGYFVKKKKTDRGFEYSLVKEILALAPEEIYDLTRKTGQGRFTLDDAMKKVPTMKKYVRAAKTPSLGRGPGRPPRTSAKSDSVVMADANLAGLLGSLVRELSVQGGLNVNVHLTVQFRGLTG
jgi:hypothetical protein